MFKGKSHVWFNNYATATADEGAITMQDESAATDNNEICSMLRNMHGPAAFLIRSPADVNFMKDCASTHNFFTNSQNRNLPIKLRDDICSHELSMSEREHPNFESQRPFRFGYDINTPIRRNVSKGSLLSKNGGLND